MRLSYAYSMNAFYTKPSLLDFSSAHEPSEQDFNINIWGPIIEAIFSDILFFFKIQALYLPLDLYNGTERKGLHHVLLPDFPCRQRHFLFHLRDKMLC